MSRKVILGIPNKGRLQKQTVDFLKENGLEIRRGRGDRGYIGKLIGSDNIELIKSTNNLFIKIEDDGPGIDEKEYDNVFKPFYKIDKGRADSKSSVGLGLSIASDIIRSHGGNIKLEKSNMNGLSVKIFLPV